MSYHVLFMCRYNPLFYSFVIIIENNKFNANQVFSNICKRLEFMLHMSLDNGVHHSHTFIIIIRVILLITLYEL